MPIPDTSGVPPFADFQMVVTKLNEIVQKYNNLLVNLDTMNVISLNAEVIEAGSITGDKIAANAVTADKMDVNELSAITANLGHITAGLIQTVTMIGSVITGSLIQTVASGTYPRTALSSSSQVFSVEGDPNKRIWIYVAGTDPTFRLSDLSGISYIEHVGGNLNVFSSGRINLNNLFIGSKQIVPGYNGSVAVMDPSGATRYLNFNNGIFQSIT